MPRHVLPDTIGIGPRMKARRIELGIGPGELSDKLHVSLGMVNHYETGKRLPSLETLITMAKVLRISTDELLGLRKPRKPDIAAS